MEQELLNLDTEEDYKRQDLLIEENIQDLQDLNKELSKKGIYPIKNISYSVVKHLCGFKTYKRVYEGFVNLLDKKKILNMDYEKLIRHFLKDYSKLNKKNYSSFLKVIVRPKEIKLSYVSVNQITKSISLKYNNQEQKKDLSTL